MGAYGIGNVASNLLIASRPPRNLERTLFLGGAIFGFFFIGLAFVESLPAALLIVGLAAIGGPMTDLVLLLVIQTNFPADRIGKVYSLRLFVSHTCRGVGLIVAAPLFGLVSVRTGIVAGATIVLVYSLVALARFGSTKSPDDRNLRPL